MNRHDYYTPGEVHVRAREDGGESRTIEGYAIVFGQPSLPLYQDESAEVREVISREAVSREMLDDSDIVMTLYHNSDLLLGRSKNGTGTLRYDIDERGVHFELDVARTVDGDRALELVRRGDIDGCSFAFTTKYGDRDYVAHEVTRSVDGKTLETFTVRRVNKIYDFTLTPRPAYPATSVEARALVEAMRPTPEVSEEPCEKSVEVENQIKEMRAMARVEL